MELEKVVQEQLDTLVKEGAVEKIIRTTLEKTVASIIQDVLRDYSDFGKELKKQVATAMNISFDQMKLVDYNHIVVGIVREQLDKTLLENAMQPIADTLNKYIGGLEKKEWKLSEIIAEFTKEQDENGQFSIYLEVEDNRNFTHIYFDNEKPKSKYQSAYNINIHEGNIYGFHAGKYNSFSHKLDIKKENLGRSFDAFVFRLYASGATIQIDEEDCVLQSEFD